MGRSKMSSLKIPLFPLAICLLLILNSQVSGKPSPKHFLIETKERAKKNSDYIDNINYIKTIVAGSTNVGKDYIVIDPCRRGGIVAAIADCSDPEHLHFCSAR